ncbi:DUF3611 family protein [Halochromatium glycolicum]|uniref:Uncharacterized protein n=1 Tax=Halochromatium glycolicum TaxID=85075 RepID=A0AAJ0U305_9GAMM|nr:DUF3611 family protein [Halochromatium glycolicum]MBK1704348.1 hypothetical protein [Halochromatium glycolicum]
MLNKLVNDLHGSKVDGLAKTFQRTGRVGFWVQVVMGAFPVILMLYVFTFSGSLTGPRHGLPIVSYLTAINLLLLVFVVFWFSRYPGVGRKIADPATRPSEGNVTRTVWTGLIASSLGIVFSMLVMLIEVSQLLFYFLAAPQGGVPTIQTTPTSMGGSWVSAVDFASLMALVLVLAAEVLATIFGLWLLFRTTHTYESLED